MAADIFVGVDLGGTSLQAMAVSEDGTVLGQAKRKTKARKGADAVIERLAETVARALDEAHLQIADVAGIGVGVPGPLDPVNGVVHSCPNMGPGWANIPLVDRLESIFERPVVIENDVNVGALAEYLHGAGRGARTMLGIFVGTGIGGGLMMNGTLQRGSRNSAAEVGHMVLLANGPLCGCGQQGHAETLASRSAIDRDIRAAIRGGRQSVISEWFDITQQKPLGSGLIGKALDMGDRVTIEAVNKAQFFLGLLIGSCVNLIDPDRVVVGGGLLERLGEPYLGPARDVAEQHYVNKEGDVQVVVASLGDLGGAIGAAEVARQHLS